MSGRANGGWRKKYRVQAQVLALLIATTASFAMYAALESGLTGLAAASFALLALSMLLTILVG